MPGRCGPAGHTARGRREGARGRPARSYETPSPPSHIATFVSAHAIEYFLGHRGVRPARISVERGLDEEVDRFSVRGRIARGVSRGYGWREQWP